MKTRRMVVMLAGSALLFGGVFGFVAFRDAMIRDYFASAPRPVVAVTVATASEKEWRGTVFAVGTLRAVNGVDVAASTSGLVKEIAFRSGQEVKRGDQLLRLDADVELGDLRSAEAELVLARTTHNRNSQLLRSSTVSIAAAEKSEAELKVHQAKLAALQAQIAKKSVMAPFDGVLGVRKVDLGQYLQPGEAIVNLQDLSRILCDLSVSQKDLAAVEPGQPVRMTTDAWPGLTFEGTVTVIEPEVEAKTGMVAVQASFPNPDRRLRPGMFARIEIDRPVAGKVVAVPTSAVSYNLYGDAVFVVREGTGTDGKPQKTVERAVVQLGDRRHGTVVVKQGIAAGDVVVTSGQVKLENGSPVRIAAEDPLRGPAGAASP